MRAVKSVSIDSERRVIITYLDGSTETLYPNCIWCDSEALRQLIKDLLEEKADAITQTIENVTVATFADGADEGLIKKLLVNIEPIQEGTGDPSPENIRPISGRTGLTVYRSGIDTSNPTAFPVSWESEAGTVYGGRLDVVSGKLTVSRAKVTFDGTQQNLGFATGVTANRIAWGEYNDIGAIGTDFISDSLKSSTSSSSVKSDPWLVYNATGAPRMFITVPTSIASVSDFNAYTAQNPITVIFELGTTKEIQLTPQEITTMLGDNNIWTDSGNILELEYTADTKLYIGEQQSGTLGLGRQTIAIPDLQPVSEKTWEDVSEAYKEEATDERGEE